MPDYQAPSQDSQNQDSQNQNSRNQDDLSDVFANPPGPDDSPSSSEPGSKVGQVVGEKFGKKVYSVFEPLEKVNAKSAEEADKKPEETQTKNKPKSSATPAEPPAVHQTTETNASKLVEKNAAQSPPDSEAARSELIEEPNDKTESPALTEENSKPIGKSEVESEAVESEAVGSG